LRSEYNNSQFLILNFEHQLDKLEFEGFVNFFFVYGLFKYEMYDIVKKWEGCACSDM